MKYLVLLLMVLARPLGAEPVVVFAAASLKGPLDEIFDEADVALSYGGSGAMAQQIARGAPADIYLSANADWMDWLQADGLIDGGSRVDLLGNSLVVVSFQIAGEVSPGVLMSGGAIGIGQRDAVPAGQYAMAALTSLGLVEDVEGRLVEVESVAAVARLVLLREVAFGIVYATDAQGAGLPIAARFSAESHPPIVYPLALTAGAGPEAAGVLAALQSDAALQVFADHGFEVLP